jgi:hypothetical protein
MTIEEFNTKYKIAGQLEFIAGNGGLPMIRVNNAKAAALISLHAGQVLSYQPAGEPEDVLFLSEKAYYQDGKAIKGGAPICWPWFGADPEGKGRPGHGFVRNRAWNVVATEAMNNGDVKVTLGLEDTPDTRAIWPLEYELSMLDNPHRVVIDLNNTKLNPVLHTLPQKVDAIDPFVQNIRIGQFTPHVIRLVFDLKAHVVPRTFVVPPKENFAYRLILDIYHPHKAANADLNTRTQPAAKAKFETDVLDELVASLIQDSIKQESNLIRVVPPSPPKIQPPQPVMQAEQPGSFQAAQYRKPNSTPQKKYGTADYRGSN